MSYLTELTNSLQNLRKTTPRTYRKDRASVLLARSNILNAPMDSSIGDQYRQIADSYSREAGYYWSKQSQVWSQENPQESQRLLDLHKQAKANESKYLQLASQQSPQILTESQIAELDQTIKEYDKMMKKDELDSIIKSRISRVNSYSKPAVQPTAVRPQ